MPASPGVIFFFFFFNDTATTEIYTLSLHDALPISLPAFVQVPRGPLKTCIWIEYDDFLQCHAATVPECMNQRNLSRWPGIMTDRAPLSCKLAYFGVCMAFFEQEVHLVPVEN